MQSEAVFADGDASSDAGFRRNYRGINVLPVGGRRLLSNQLKPALARPLKILKQTRQDRAAFDTRGTNTDGRGGVLYPWTNQAAHLLRLFWFGSKLARIWQSNVAIPLEHSKRSQSFSLSLWWNSNAGSAAPRSFPRVVPDVKRQTT